jgi:16S rRNA (guanine(966)-N(2))-methyltransferase RsmD
MDYNNYTMHISGGELKGRKIPVKALLKGELRATSGKVRESIFNILGGSITGAVFVDLYSGTGAVGFEAMSRGARSVYFVEADRGRATAIEDLLEGCGCRRKAIVVKKKAADFINDSEAEGLVFDIVFMDPPYNSPEAQNVLPLLGGGRALADGAIVLAEHMSRVGLPGEAGSLLREKTYRYGDTSLTLYGKSP